MRKGVSDWVVRVATRQRKRPPQRRGRVKRVSGVADDSSRDRIALRLLSGIELDKLVPQY